ncbi:hypothetical protein PoB_004608400 [Plakobranchus ocellatus]|uniref:Uncharacterized protein n=1 Tax=Plakobranchus ocellatus TaxID=259542 RepID=A0AAV4BHL5_9GAST|nr:hypothetical protein PoB_004608400 [Plakobranchus ocellatus]
MTPPPSPVTPKSLKIAAQYRNLALLLGLLVAVFRLRWSLVSRLLHDSPEELPHRACRHGQCNPVLPPNDIALSLTSPSRGASSG